MLIGAILRLWQYRVNSSLWIDELALTSNILDRPFTGLLHPLDYAQVAPVGFLFVEKSLTLWFGSSEYALRAFPLACGLASLFLFWGVAKRVLSGWGIPFAVGLFSLGIPFVYFSSQVKQYSSDVAAALLLLLAALETHRRGVTRGRALRLGALGALIAWFSQPAVFVMVGIVGAQLIFTIKAREREVVRCFLIVSVLWAASAAAVSVHSLTSVSQVDRDYFQWFWSNGFMPMPPRTLAELAWLPGKLTWVFGAFGVGLGHTNGGLNYRWSPVFAAVAAWGFWTLWQQQRDAALFLLLPIMICIGLSAFSVYPFTARVIAFLIPYLLVATAAGASHLLTHWPHRIQFLFPAALGIFAGAPVHAAATSLPPSLIQHFRPVIQHVKEHRAGGDVIFVYYGAGLAFRYYAPKFRLSDDHVIYGRCHVGDPRHYLRELDALRGASRVWVVATHEQRTGELEMITGYLDRIGRRLDEVVVPATNRSPIEAAYGYLYDFSDLERLTSTSAERYEPMLPPATGALAVWGCHGIVDQPPG